MTQNRVSEYQIPKNDTLQNEVPVDEVRQNVYNAYDSKEVQTKTNDQKVEFLSNQIIEKMISFGDDINQARNKVIDSMPVNASHHVNNMRRFFKSVSGLMFSREMPNISNKEIVRNELISKESIIGASLFGLVSSKDNRYEFFYEGRETKNNTIIDNWFYHEDKLLTNGEKRQSRTLHYEILEDGVFLVGLGYLTGDELKRFLHVTEAYRDKVMNKIYNNKNTVIDKNVGFSSKTVKKIIDFVDKTGLGGSDFTA